MILPGRTECIEKYGRAARDLVARGYSVISIDWRGQGLADRPLADHHAGHVGDFSEYQQDLDAMLAEAERAGLPKPYFMLAHSMGGAIGLRGLVRGLLPLMLIGLISDVHGNVEAMEKAMAEATDYANGIAKEENDKALETMRAAGTTEFHDLSADELAAWKDALAPVQAEMADRIGAETIAAVNAATGQ